MKRIFVFDLDDTLGRKTPTYPNITVSNANFLRELSSNTDNLLFLATGRPRTQAIVGLSKGGIKPEERYFRLFYGGVYEDGLFVESRLGVNYNAMNEVPDRFRRVKLGFFDQGADDFFQERGFALFFNGMLSQLGEGKYVKEGYDGTDNGEIVFPERLVPLWRQGNDVRETYKAPLGYEQDNLDKQQPLFERVFEVTREHLDLRFPGWQKLGKLEKWKDAVELYPRLKGREGVFIKGEGLMRLLDRVQAEADTPVVLCCDGRNDISLVKYIAQRFPRTQVVCPSNVSEELIGSLREGNYRHTVLQENCESFTDGLTRIIEH